MATERPEALNPSSVAAECGPGDQEIDPLVTPYEAWCQAHGVHPESSLAWASYRRSLDSPPA